MNSVIKPPQCLMKMSLWGFVISLILQLVEVVVDALILEKFFVRADFSDFPFVKNDDSICISNGAESMGNHKCSSIADDSADGILDQTFSLGVDIRSRLVKNQDIRIEEEGSGK